MGWMSLPETTYDFYVDPVSGSDANTGKSWSQAYATCGQAAASSGSYGRVWLAPASYQFGTTPISYTNKRIQWVGPPTAAHRFEAANAAAYFTGTANALAYFMNEKTSEGHNLFGGGFHNIVFDADALASGGNAIYLQQVNYAQIEGCLMAASTGTYKAAYLLKMDALPTTSTNDKSWLTVRNCEVTNCGLVYGPSAGGGFNGWLIEDVRGDTDASGGATVPYIHLVDKTQGLFLAGGLFENTASGVSAVKIDQTGVSNSRTVNVSGLAFEGLASPYYGVELLNCQAFVSFAGGAANSDGLIYGDASTTGYMAVPSAFLAGSLVTGVN